MSLMYYIIFYQQSVTHFLLTDCNQQRHFHYSTHELLITEIPFFHLCSPIFNRPTVVAQFYFLRVYV